MLGFGLRPRHDRQVDRRKNANDGDYNQEFNQRETSFPSRPAWSFQSGSHTHKSECVSNLRGIKRQPCQTGNTTQTAYLDATGIKNRVNLTQTA